MCPTGLILGALLQGMATWYLGTTQLLLPWWCLRLLLLLLACPRHFPQPLRALGVLSMVFPHAVGALSRGCLLGLVAANAFLLVVGQVAHPTPDRLLTVPLEVIEVLTLVASYSFSLVGM